jgi:hypothetical protein
MSDLDKLARSLFEEVMEKREEYLKAWIAETGYLPSECELVERHDHLERVIYVRKKAHLKEDKE